MADQVTLETKTTETNTKEIDPENLTEHEQNMVNKAEGVVTPPKEEPKTTIPEKFVGKSVEEVIASYTELESKYSEATKPKEDVKEPTESQDSPFIKYTQELQEKGELSPESYADLAKQGFSKEIVDDYIAAKKDSQQLSQVQIERNEAKVVEVAGGEDAMTEMLTWAKDGLTKEQQDWYNEQVDSGDVNKSIIAVDYLKTKFNSNSAPNLVKGGEVVKGAKVYNDWSEVKADMKDPRYGQSEHFRKQVEAGIASSKI